MGSVGTSVPRKDAPTKVSGSVRYVADYRAPGLLYARPVTSLYAHAKILSVDASEARKVPGVRAVVTADDVPILCGPAIQDRPPLAWGKVRYFGEPVVLVIADGQAEATRAAHAVKVEYEPLRAVNSPRQALEPGAPVIHELLGEYSHHIVVHPEAGTNIAGKVAVRKGDAAKAMAESEVVVEGSFSLPQKAHAAMETRACMAEVLTDGKVVIHTTSQTPFSVRKYVSKYFHIPMADVLVKTPFVGGAFGGKSLVQMEILAYIASRAVDGRRVMLANTREQDMTMSPAGIGLESTVKLGATRDGRILAAEIVHHIDTGAYTDSSPHMARAMASGSTGPYNIENVACDTFVVYTNHNYVTAFRSFGWVEATFPIERMVDKLAFALGMDPAELRQKNAIKPGQSSPTGVRTTRSNVGDLTRCLERVQQLIQWDEGQRIDLGNGKVRSKGLACLWKTSSSPTDAISAVTLIMNEDGSINLMSGAVEMGPGTKTTAAQILAEQMKMNVDDIHVVMEVDTETTPRHWKTVASMSTFMVGRAVIEAAENLIHQLKSVAATVMRCPPEDLEIGAGKVFLRDDPEHHLAFKDLAQGYKYVEGHAIGGPIVGHGSFIMRHLTPVDPLSGHGKPGPFWTVGAQAVEIELDTRTCMYRILKAATVLDAGRLINPKGARGVVMGGMSMGLGLASREGIVYSDSAQLVNPQFRTYKLMRLGEEPEYLVDFVETPELTGPFGARGIGEHGIIGMPAAFTNAMCSAAHTDFHALPITPEAVWQAARQGGAFDDSRRLRILQAD